MIKLNDLLAFTHELVTPNRWTTCRNCSVSCDLSSSSSNPRAQAMKRHYVPQVWPNPSAPWIHSTNDQSSTGCFALIVAVDLGKFQNLSLFSRRFTVITDMPTPFRRERDCVSEGLLFLSSFTLHFSFSNTSTDYYDEGAMKGAAPPTSVMYLRSSTSTSC